ncbi:hypothetical protein PV328_011774 [Microctonus aethiopoides]|uniref:Uncharacterized protein n=1 Tax=Microctonus aethiopoides TaxID=144406 RepID=A0AA39FHI6_9HYME|nr:hypothetical protein PV328_011774 [Microctonus aethiopoides]
MDIGVNITKNLSPKEIKFLEFVPPHTRNYDAVLEKIFDNKAGPEAYQFRRDLIEFHDSVMRIGRLRVDEMNEYNCKVCPRCEYVKKTNNGFQDIIVSAAGANDDDDESYDITGNEYPMSLHYEKQKNWEDVSCSATVAIDEKKIYTMKDLIIHMMNEAENIFIMAEQIYKFMRIRMPNQSIYRESAGNVLIDDKAENIHGVTRMVFKSPFNWDELPKHYKSMNLWVMRNYHGILWDAGDIPYNKLNDVPDIILKDGAYIYVKGSEKKQWLSDIIRGSKTIINLENLGCPSMKNIEITSCHYHEYRKSNLIYHCALENVKQLKG